MNAVKKNSVRKSKKVSLRIDLTPMVDLGFLLISFFVFTTTLAKPTAMHLTVPDDNNIKDPSEVPISKTLNLVLGANNNVFYYEGDSLNQMENVSTKASDLRDAIINKKIKLKNFLAMIQVSSFSSSQQRMQLIKILLMP